MTTNRQLYMEKRKEVHTPEEFAAAFENNVAIVFELKKERNPSDKRNLFAGIWEINPEALIAEDCDLCVLSPESAIYNNQILIIDKGGDKETANRILDLMYKAGVVPCCYVTFKEKKNGVKRCIFQKFENKTTVVKKMNLIADYGNLLVTVRNLSSADHDKKET